MVGGIESMKLALFAIALVLLLLPAAPHSEITLRQGLTFSKCQEDRFTPAKELCVVIFEVDHEGYASATMVVCPKDSLTCDKRDIGG